MVLSVKPLLEIDKLRVHYSTSEGSVRAVDGVSMAVEKDQVFGLAGESGCGKSTLIRAIMRLLPPTASVSASEMRFDGRDLNSMSDAQYRKEILWCNISLVPQSAMNSLNPVYRVGDQIVEAFHTHGKDSKKDIQKRIDRLFRGVGLEPALIDRFPHELSGGMRQRVMIAMAMALNPALIIMDEPTTGLDVLVQERILREIREIRKQSGVAIILITHDISVIAEMSDRIGIMYAGRIMEQADAQELFDNPTHPYTIGLKNAFPSIHALDRQLISIPGSPPNLVEPLPGCVFASRCPFAIPDCSMSTPPDMEISPGHFVHCLRSDHADEFVERGRMKTTWRFLK